METDHLKGPLVRLTTVLGGERAGQLLRTGWREGSGSGGFRKFQKEKETHSHRRHTEPIKDQRKRENLFRSVDSHVLGDSKTVGLGLFVLRNIFHTGVELDLLFPPFV